MRRLLDGLAIAVCCVTLVFVIIDIAARLFPVPPNALMVSKSYADSLSGECAKCKITTAELDSQRLFQIDYLEVQLSVEQNKVLQIQRDLDRCNNDKNYHVITVHGQSGTLP